MGKSDMQLYHDHKNPKIKFEIPLLLLGLFDILMTNHISSPYLYNKECISFSFIPSNDTY